MPFLRTVAAILVCATLGLAAELRTLSGKTLVGDLVSVSDKEIVLRGDTGPVPTPLADVLNVTLQPSTSTGPSGTVRSFRVALTDGSVLHCGAFRPVGKEVELPLAAADGKAPVTLKLPLAAVASVLGDAQDQAWRQEWQEKYLAKQGKSDLLAFKTAAGVQRLEGTFGDGDSKGESIAFTVARKTYHIEMGKVQGMLFVRRANPDAPVPACKVYDVGGNVLATAKVELTDAGFKLTTTTGAEVTYPRQLVARLDYGQDKLVYLSDLDPVQVVEKSTLDRVEHYRRDRNLDDGPIRLGGEKFGKGLALHARTELVFDLGGRFREFKAVVGVDDLVGGDSQAVLRIDGDGRELFSGVVTRKDKPRPVAFDVKGVRQLRIVVGSQGLLDLGDHVDLADVRVSK
jgi:NPCBM/NEW2 domain